MTMIQAQRDMGVALDTTVASPLEDTEDIISNREGDIRDWDKQTKECLREIRPDTIQSVAHAWGVSEDSLRTLEAGFMAPCWVTFPMRGTDGTIVGIRKRKWDDLGEKHSEEGGKNGLFIPRGVTIANVQLICEGESDTAAALTLGFAAIGRPGTHGCKPEAVEFTSARANACPCIMVDNDDAGESGAESLSWALEDKGVPCKMLRPPKKFKDLRDWRQKGGLTTEQLQQAITNAKIIYPKGYTPGFSQPPSALMQSGVIARIGAAPVLLLGVIWSYRDNEGRMYPEREELAEHMGVTVRTIDRYNEALAGEGLLSWRQGHKGRANEYYIDWGPCKALKQKYQVYPALLNRWELNATKTKPKTKTRSKQ
jgi:hypothetical protein